MIFVKIFVILGQEFNNLNSNLDFLHIIVLYYTASFLIETFHSVKLPKYTFLVNQVGHRLIYELFFTKLA